MAGVIETVQIGGRVPADLAERFAEVAKANERSVAAELRLALRVYVEDNQPKEDAA